MTASMLEEDSDEVWETIPTMTQGTDLYDCRTSSSTLTAYKPMVRFASITNLAQGLTRTRRGCSRHYQAQSEWLLHRCCMQSISCLSRCADNKQSVHAATRKTLLKVKGFSEVKVEKIKEAIVKCQVSKNTVEETIQYRIPISCL